MTRAAVALGSNLGDRVHYLRLGVAELSQLGSLEGVSSLYETAPVGGPEQAPYFNAVAVIETSLGPGELLAELHRIEAMADRVRDVRWGPRTLDLDLILMTGVVVDDLPRIGVPHPRYHERRFVLDPLLEVWPDAADPRGRDVRTDAERVRDQVLELVASGPWFEFGVDGAGDAIITDEADQTVHGGNMPDGQSGSGVPEHVPGDGRGGQWVIAQFLLLAATFTASALWRPSLPAWTRNTGVVLVLLAGLLGGAGLSSLGRNLTPFPEPIAGGTLIRSGVYGLVRHPIYGAVALGAVGWAMWSRSLVGLVVAVVTVAFFYRKAGAEEARLVRAYPEYEEYRRSTRRRMIPWVL